MYWLESKLKADGSWAGGNRVHVVCALVAAETYGMTGKHKEMAQKAVDFMARQQAPLGGWGDGPPGAARDTATTAWAVMAAKSAKLSELNVPTALFEGAQKYLQAAGAGETGKAIRVAAAIEGQTPVPSKDDASIPAAAISMLYLGTNPENPWIAGAAAEMAKEGIRLDDFPRLYLGTLSMFQVGGTGWDAWNAGLKKGLLEAQDKSGGDADGSWEPPAGRPGGEPGRASATALGAMSLEVYYRYLPIYKR